MQYSYFFTPTIKGIFFFGKPLMGRISVSQNILTIKFFYLQCSSYSYYQKSALFAFFVSSLHIYKTYLRQFFAQF